MDESKEPVYFSAENFVFPIRICPKVMNVDGKLKNHK